MFLLASSELRGGFCASVPEAAPEELRQALDLLEAGEMLRTEVRRIKVASYFPELEVSLPDPLLDPQALRVDVPELP